MSKVSDDDDDDDDDINTGTFILAVVGRKNTNNGLL
jgi:hypothetical protein